ncbi:hypothetical protein PsorP6_003654 [Peronosclerospora sorghi]|uniref:Uncharacterized protein n=1 Tax=Peronosclerospora sorghi TaxID=230839 RepID=A0ACC0VQD0_9STRA|nr:hypothetical protein PsorP6_003654 [Peronosclerospora sorghi]
MTSNHSFRLENELVSRRQQQEQTKRQMLHLQHELDIAKAKLKRLQRIGEPFLTHFYFHSVYLFSTFVCLIGNIIYTIADTHMARSLTAIDASRFIVGFGCGNRCLCCADVVSITTINQRLPYLTILVCVVYLGYALTPGLGSLVANTDLVFYDLSLNKFTSPGIILVLLNVLTIFGILTVYDESITEEEDQSITTTLKKSTLLPDRIVHIGIGIFIFLNFNIRGIISVFESVNVPLFFEATNSDPRSVSVVWMLHSRSLGHYWSQYVDASDFQFTLASSVYCPMEPLNTFATTFWMRIESIWVLPWSLPGISCSSWYHSARPRLSCAVLPLLPTVMPTLVQVFWIDIVLCASSIGLLWWYTNLVLETKITLLAYVENAYQEASLTNTLRSPSADVPEKD